jgi:predicted Na+-dependent transporter
VLIPPLLLLNLFVVVVMFSIGLRVSGGELLDILRKRSLFVRTLLANCVLIPAIGFLLVRIFPLTPDASVGILLLAAIPGTPIALQFTRQAKTRLAFAAAMTFVLSLVSVAMTPLAVEVMPQTAQRNQRPILLLMMNRAVAGELLFRQLGPTENAIRRECLAISDIQEEETEVQPVKRTGCNNVTLVETCHRINSPGTGGTF